MKEPAAVQEARAQSLGLEDPPEEETATHSSTLARKIPRTGERGGGGVGTVHVLGETR